MKFQLVIDSKGVTLFPEHVKLAYGPDNSGRNVYYDTANKERGAEELYQLANAMGMINCGPGINWVHCRRMIEIKEMPLPD